MMPRLLLFQFRKRLPLCLVGGLLMGLLSASSLLIYDEHSIELIGQLRAAAPFPAAFLGLSGSANLVDHLRSLCYGFLLPLIGFAFVIATARRLIAGQLESGELAYYLALPLRRSSILLMQAMVLLLCSLLMVLVQAALCALAAFLLKPGEMNGLWYLWLNLGLLAQLMITGGIAIMFSAIHDEARPAGRAAWLLTGFIFLISMLARWHQLPGFLKYVGIYGIIDLQALSTGRPELIMLAPLGLGLICLLIGIQRFAGRDLAL